MDRSIPDERTRGEDDTPNEDKTLGTPFSKVPPILRWQGKTLCILQLPAREANVWISFPFSKPTKFNKLVSQKETKSEKVFFNMGTQKFLRVTPDNISWSYYVTGPFQRLEAGAWLDVDAGKELKEEELEAIGEDEDDEEKCYKLNPLTGIVKVLPSKGEKKEKIDDQNGQEVQKNNSYDEIIKEIQKARTEKKLDDKENLDKKTVKNEEVWNKGGSLLSKINELEDIKNWKEAIIKGEGSQIPTIRTNKIMEAFEEVCGLYEIGNELVRHQSGSAVISFPIDSMNDVKFAVGVILPELYLYPQSFLKSFGIKHINFCGLIKKSEKTLMWTIERRFLSLNTKERNIMKIQQGLHQSICGEILRLFKENVSSFETSWKALNSPDFAYSATRKKAPKGIKGFLTFDSLLSYENDVKDIYFALIKDPKTVLEHSDIIIAKKAHLLKTALSELCPEGINDKWWAKVQGYKDIIELALGTTDTFKEANLINPDEPEVEPEAEKKDEA